jgi:hypothetical protein
MGTHLIVKHQVQDFSIWKPAFDAHKSEQLKHGLHLIGLLQNTDNKNDLTIHFDVKDLELAKQFMHSAELRDVMQKAGVMGKPETLFLQDAKEH